MMIEKKTKKDKSDGLEIVVEKLNLLEKIANMLTTYGYKKVISSLFIFMLLIVTIIIFTNQKEIISRIVREQTVAIQLNNAKTLDFRVKVINPRVDAILYKLLAESGADRVYVIEMHNGIDNPTGLPFAFGDMTYEKIKNDSSESVMNQYNRVNLSSMPISTYLFKYKCFFGTVKDLSVIDLKLAKRAEMNGTNFIGLYSIRGNDVSIGWVGISYHSKAQFDDHHIEGCLLDASQRLSILLDLSNNVELK